MGGGVDLHLLSGIVMHSVRRVRLAKLYTYLLFRIAGVPYIKHIIDHSPGGHTLRLSHKTTIESPSTCFTHDHARVPITSPSPARVPPLVPNVALDYCFGA